MGDKVALTLKIFRNHSTGTQLLSELRWLSLVIHSPSTSVNSAELSDLARVAVGMFRKVGEEVLW